MEPTKFIWQNGRFIQWEDAKQHVLTHSLHYGAGAFEGIRAYGTDQGPAVFRLKDHVRRLFFSADVISMEIPFSEEEIEAAILELIKKNSLKSCYIRPIAFFGYGIMGVHPANAPVEVSVCCWPWGAYIAKEVASVKISTVRRSHPDTTISSAKLTGNYLNSVLACLEAKKLSYDEALLLDTRGYIAEGPGENFFLVKDGALVTPRPLSILPGITRATVMEIALKMGLSVKEADILPEEVWEADEAFFTGTAAEVHPIGYVDGRGIGDGQAGSITRRLSAAYLNIVHGRVAEYNHFLSRVTTATATEQRQFP